MVLTPSRFQIWPKTALFAFIIYLLQCLYWKNVYQLNNLNFYPLVDHKHSKIYFHKIVYGVIKFYFRIINLDFKQNLIFLNISLYG
jgi:hypothetical protein